jgi:hypothetical protein
VTEPRLASAVLVKALQRKAESEGGFAAILSRGDSDSGAVLVILAEKGRKVGILERLLTATGRYAWTRIGDQALANEEEIGKFLRRRRDFDPDIWLIELDIASAERFAAEMNEAL